MRSFKASPYRIARYTSGSSLTTGPGGVMYREVAMVEITEVLRLCEGVPTKRVAAQLAILAPVDYEVI